MRGALKYTLLQGVRGLLTVPGLMANPPSAAWRGSGTTGITSPVTVEHDNAAIRYLNAVSTHASGSYQVNPDASEAMVFEFVTAATLIDIRVLRFNSTFFVFVDNELISLTEFSTDSAGSADILALDFTGTPKANTSKKIKLIGVNMLFSRVFLSTGASATLPSPNRPLVAVLGDSYTQGSGTSDATKMGAGVTWARHCLDALGYDYLPEGVGSTGYLTAAGPTAAATRMSDRLGVIPHTPAFVLLALGFNDAGGDMGVLATNYAATVAAANTAFPGVPVVTQGPWTPVGATANLILVKNALIAAAATASSQFIDIQDIINTSNMAIYTDVDNTHPNVAGHAFLGNAIAQRMLAAGLRAAA